MTFQVMGLLLSRSIGEPMFRGVALSTVENGRAFFQQVPATVEIIVE